MNACKEAAEKIKPLLEEIQKMKEEYGLDRVDVKACVNGVVIDGYQGGRFYRTFCFKGCQWESREGAIKDEGDI